MRRSLLLGLWMLLATWMSACAAEDELSFFDGKTINYVVATKPGSATIPFPGISADVVNEAGESVPLGGGGFLAITKPWPSMARTIYGDDQRFIDTYWSRFEGKYFAGDGAKRDEDRTARSNIISEVTARTTMLPILTISYKRSPCTTKAAIFSHIRYARCSRSCLHSARKMARSNCSQRCRPV